jgi:outer membrane protein assembly factor BamB
VKYVAGYSRTVDLTATQTTPLAGTAYIKLVPDSNIIQSAQARPDVDGSFAITLFTSASAAVGHHTGQITVHVCKDEACISSFDGAPFKVPYVIDIVSPAGGTTPSSLTALVPIAGAGDWSGYQGNAAHTGFVPVVLAPAKFTVRWKYEAPSVNGIQLTISDIATSAGRLYFSTRNWWDSGRFPGHDLYAFNEHDGTPSWIHGFNDLATPGTNPPGVANGKVYVSAGSQGSTAMFAFDATNGTQLFSTPGASQWEHYLAPVVVGGSVYSEGGTYGGMFAFDADTGVRQWFIRLEQTSEWTPAVDANNAYVYMNDALEIIDRLTGATVRQIPGVLPRSFLSGGGRVTPLIGSPGDVIVTGGDNLMSFDTAKGEMRWTVPGHFGAGAAYDNQEIFVLNTDPFVLEARSETDGSTLWSWIPPAPTSDWLGNVLLTQNLVFVSTDNATYAIDRTSHTTVWTQPFSGKLTLSANGVLYINSGTSILAINVK